MRSLCAATALVLLTAVSVIGDRCEQSEPSNTGYLTWTSDQAHQIGGSTRVSGRVSGGQGLLHTERAYRYKLRATWLTSEVIRATARLLQLAEGLPNDRTEALVKEADAAGDIVFMVEIDPIEGSGVIPLDWVVLLEPKGSHASEPRIVKGTSVPQLRDVRALSGVFRRDYDYEVFWIVFPRSSQTAASLLPESATEVELVVRIYNKEGRVKWPIPESMKRRQGGND
jgi:hypothetical protein